MQTGTRPRQRTMGGYRSCVKRSPVARLVLVSSIAQQGAEIAFEIEISIGTNSLA